MHTVLPSRFDFAKERYGGPFTTENVKTFLWILIVLFSIGPIFTLEVHELSSYFTFPIFGFHTLHHIGLGKDFCTGQSIDWMKVTKPIRHMPETPSLQYTLYNDTIIVKHCRYCIHPV